MLDLKMTKYTLSYSDKHCLWIKQYFLFNFFLESKSVFQWEWVTDWKQWASAEGSQSSPKTGLEYHCPNWFESELSFTSLDSPSRQHTQSVVCTLSNQAGCPMAVLQHWHSHTNSQYNLKVTFFSTNVLISLIIIMRYISFDLTQFSNSDCFWVLITVGKI